MQVILEDKPFLIEQSEETKRVLTELKEFSSKKENWWEPGKDLSNPALFSRAVKMKCSSGKHEHNLDVLFTWTVGDLVNARTKERVSITVRHVTMLMDNGNGVMDGGVLFNACLLLGFREDYEKWHITTHPAWRGAITAAEITDEQLVKDKNIDMRMLMMGPAEPQEKYFPSYIH